MDSAGNFVIIWSDNRNGERDIYGQLYDTQANKVGTNFVINDDGLGSETQDEPAVSFLQDGKFAAVWTDQRTVHTTDRDIYCQIYNPDGSMVGSNFKVNDDGAASRAGQRTAYISPDGPSTFAVTWGDARANELDMYYQRFTLSGIPVGSNFKVNDDTVKNFFGWCPYISSNTTNQTVIVWRDNRMKYVDPMIWGQKFNPATGQKVDTNFCINPNGKCGWQSLVRVSSAEVDSEGNFYVVWCDGRRVTNAIDTYMQMYNPNGDTVGSAIRINTNLTTDADNQLLASAPAIAVRKNSGGTIHSVVVWQDKPDTQDFAIMLQSYDKTLNAVGNNISIVPDAGTRSQTYPQIAMNPKGNFVITWEERREWNHCDIFAQSYDKAGTPFGNNFKVNPDACSDNAVSAVAMDTNGIFTVVWRALSCYLYARQFYSDGTPVDTAFLVTPLLVGFGMVASEPKIAVDGKSNFVITWEDSRLDPKFPDIFAQRFSSDCSFIDTIFKVNDDTIGGCQHLLPNISMNKNGEFVIVWEQEEYLQDKICYDIRGQRFDSSGAKIGANFVINDDAAFAVQQYNPSVAIKENSQFVVVWEDYRNGNTNADIYCQLFTSSGLPISSNFKINNDIDSSLQRYPSVALNHQTGEFIATWSDSKGKNSKIIAQMLDSSGVPVGSEFVVHNTPAHPSNQRLIRGGRSVAANSELIAFTWIDNCIFKGWDIYAKLIGQKPGVEDNGQPKITISPNPTYKQLTVRYVVPKRGTYSVSLYDKAGRSLVHQPQGEKYPGVYTTEIDISAYSSGVYFVKFEGTALSDNKTIQNNVNKVVIFRHKK